MMDLSILVFFQRWLINSNKELNNYGRANRKDEGAQNNRRQQEFKIILPVTLEQTA